MKKLLLSILLTSCAQMGKNKNYQIVQSEYLGKQRVSCDDLVWIKKKNFKILNEAVFSDYIKCKSSDAFKKEEQKFAINQEKKRKNSIASFIKENPKYKKYKQVAEQKKVHIGMPEELFYLSWGKPKKSNKSGGKWGINKQLIYPGFYIYIRKGVISSLQSR